MTGTAPAPFTADDYRVRRERAARAAADRVFEEIRNVPFSGRRESEVGAGLADQLRRFGHSRVVFHRRLRSKGALRFSTPPGVCLPGRFGVRVEDIVTVTEDGGRRFDDTTREMAIVD